MTKYHLYQTMKLINHSNSSLNSAIIQTDPSYLQNKMMIIGQEKKYDTVYIIYPKI